MTVTLVLRALGLGDLLTALPALRALRAGPGGHLVLTAPEWLRPVVELADCVDELLPTDGLGALRWRRRPPDLAVNLHGRGPASIADLLAVRPRRIITHRHPDFPELPGPTWNPTLHEVQRWCLLLESADVPADPTRLALAAPPHSGGDHIIVHPGGSSRARRWPADRFAAVAAQLRAAGHPVVLTGDTGEAPLLHRIARAAALPSNSVLAGALSLRELAATVAGARLLISGDTGVGHLATALGTPSVLIFGPNPPAWWGPPADPAHITLWAGHIGDPHASEPDPGLLRITPAEVIVAAERQLGGLVPVSGGTAPTSDAEEPSPRRKYR
ncbi:glycosyltransferase family 9 protein [Nocardia otitidiscaviarum]|uniref:glycosyltransferase family 9 protein n=1 Tax=Nocardia otitidiscaviarum TaxID=1823 RepID=UPI002455BD95|nr:glycosyltransferase family 9 protein [Nocardia otitidiscaviarum]